MESEHDKRKGNSSRNVSKKCYSLPLLQKENEKLKNDLMLLQADHDEKEALLTESLLKIELIEKQNHDLKAAVVANKETVTMKDASTCAAIVTKDGSTLTSVVIVTRPEMKDASTFVKIRKKNVSTSTSAYSETQVEKEDEVRCKPIRFDEIVLQLPYDEAFDIELFDADLAGPQLSPFMKEYFQQIGGATNSKKVNNILNELATKNLLKQFVWDKTASNSFQRLKNVLACIHSAVCSKETSQADVNCIIKNALKNARANK